MFQKKILKVSVVVVLLTFISFCHFPLAVGEENVVKTGQQALEIAHEYVSEKYQQDFEDHDIAIILHDDIWIVAYLSSVSGRYTNGGGTPQVEIKKSNGKIVNCFLQK